MKAILLKEYGLPKFLEIGDVEEPIPSENEVLVRIHSASINDWDWGLVRGKPFVIRLFFGLKKPNKGIDQISYLAEKGQLKPVVDGPYGFDKIPELIQYLGEGRHLGKFVVDITK